MKKVIALVVIGLFLSAVLVADTVYGGWKENYRTKYSKKALDSDSEKAKKIRSLCNFEFEYFKKKSPEEKAALGIEPNTTLTANIMPWKENKDKFEGYTTNFSPARRNLPKEEKTKTGQTLTDYISEIGSTFGETIDTEFKKIDKRVKGEE